LTSIQFPVGTSDPERALRKEVARRLRIPERKLLAVRVLRRSLDSRRGRKACWVHTVEAWRVGEEALHAKEEAALQERKTPEHKAFWEADIHPGKMRPIIVGAGPAGLFAALTFADHGIECVVLDRGLAVEDRHLDVRDFRRKGLLNPESNLCFGEGGAGTYSDGKLYTRKHHPLVRSVYERLVAFGATDAVLTDAHPHIGTNRLYAILKGIREHLTARGTVIRFGTRMRSLEVREGAVEGVELDSGEIIVGSPVILATGHSARDIYAELDRLGVPMTPKAFAIGARCEHPQAFIDQVQHGTMLGHPELEPAEYFLSCQVGDRGLYSFCMCPGGYIIPTPTEHEHLNVNGMSNSNRGGEFANAALVVTVRPEDFHLEKPGDLDVHGALKGIVFQREWESRAYRVGGGGYHAPAQRLTDFVEGRATGQLTERTSYRPGVTPASLQEVLPRTVIETMRQGIRQLDRKMRGYLTDESILIGVETTTSTPVRIERGEDYMSPGMDGLYPTGEGAGYSGGIVSSAIDGIRAARAALEKSHVG
jgi:uncharacterized FAD-dependent dehydrogenase